LSKLYEELQELVGKEGPLTSGVDTVCQQMIRHYCEAMEDANPLYTDEEYIRKSNYGSIIAPPAMALAFTQPQLWPDGQEMRWRHLDQMPPRETSDPYEMVMEKLEKAGYTGMFATNIALEFIRPLFPGDQATRTTMLGTVKPEKKTRAGSGHFIDLVYNFYNQKGELVSRATYTILRFKPLE
jgi:acyl dehydratase